MCMYMVGPRVSPVVLHMPVAYAGIFKGSFGTPIGCAKISKNSLCQFLAAERLACLSTPHAACVAKFMNKFQATLMACILVNGYIVWRISRLQVNMRRLPVF